MSGFQSSLISLLSLSDPGEKTGWWKVITVHLLGLSSSTFLNHGTWASLDLLESKEIKRTP